MTGLRRVLRRVDRDAREDGLGLPELMVTMMLLGLVTILVVTLFSSVTSAFTRDRAATDSANIASIGMNELTRVIRSGTEVPQASSDENRPVFLVANREVLEMHAYLDTNAADPRPVKVRFEVAGNRDLVERRWNAVAGSGPNWTFSGGPTTPASSRVIARKITPGLATPVFQYYDSTAPGALPLVVPAAGLNETQRRSIVRVEVTLSVQADLTQRAQPVVLTNEVGIPNKLDVVGAGGP